ncbi:MAG: hypothetical protein LDL41_03170 [Coleofasciculus sp. S288]|nr:hypothetical protein [Coleofasciculus sp. S288]
MAKTEEQELIAQISRLYVELRTYKKAITNPPSWIDTKILMDTVFQLEAEVRELEAELEVHQLILRMFDSMQTVAPK